MSFSDRLNTLINVFKTSNSRLARGINVDPSLVSRWRSGNRIPSIDSPYLPAIANYLLSITTYNYQTESICKMLSIEIMEDDVRTHSLLTEGIANWLSEGIAMQKPSKIIRTASFNTKPESVPGYSTPAIVRKVYNNTNDDVPYQIFLGREGKRQAVQKLFQYALSCDAPLEILLMSQEDMRWMNEDPAFLLQWSVGMQKVVEAGHKITIIHIVNREFAEINAIMCQWLKLHLSGSLRSYYHPKYIDRTSKVTYFIVRDRICIFSSVVAGQESSNVSFLFKQPLEVGVFQTNYLAHQQECKPLFEVYTEPNLLGLLADELSIGTKSGGVYSIKYSLDSLLMSAELTTRLLQRAGLSENECLTRSEKISRRLELLHSSLKINRHIFVFPLYLLTDSKNNHIQSLPGIELFCPGNIELESKDLKEYLEDAILLLEEHINLEIYLNDDPSRFSTIPSNIVFKEHYAAFLTNTNHESTNSIGLVLKEGNILHSMEMYLHDCLDSIPTSKKDKSLVIRKLKHIAANLP